MLEAMDHNPCSSAPSMPRSIPYRRASHPDQTPAGRALYQSLAFKAMRTFAQLLDTLVSRSRKGG